MSKYVDSPKPVAKKQPLKLQYNGGELITVINVVHPMYRQLGTILKTSRQQGLEKYLVRFYNKEECWVFGHMTTRAGK